MLSEEREKIDREQNYISQINYWRHNIFAYCVERLNVDPATLDWNLLPEYKNHRWDGTPNPIMAIFKAIQDGYWVVVKSAVSVNKTFTAACIVFWFLECWAGAYVATTAPKESQLLSQIWGEISNLYKYFAKGILLNGLLRMEDDTNTKYKAEAFVAGTKATKESEEKAQGTHAPHMLFVCEETPGIPTPILNAIINTSTDPHNLILALGNPNSKNDNFRAFDNLKRVIQIRISALDYPNIVCNKILIPGGQSILGLQTLKDKYTETGRLYLSRARGLTPGSSVDSLINDEWIETSVKRYNELCDKNGNLLAEKIIAYNILMQTDNVPGLGVDVANSEDGDQAAICRGIGYVCKNVTAFQNSDSNVLGDQVYQISKDESIDQRNIGIDGVGVGAGTINTLKKYGFYEGEINIIAGAAPIDLTDIEEIFINLRSQMWWMAREDFRTGKLAISGDDRELIDDLTTPKWSITTDKKIKVESKKDIKKRLSGRSTNKGDAFIMWNWKRHVNARGISYGSGISKEETEKQKPNYSSLTKRLGIK
jgi:hypothetical protein